MIYVVAFDPVKILTYWTLQSDRQNLSFVTTINKLAKKWPEIPVKWLTPSFVIFVSKQSLGDRNFSFFFDGQLVKKIAPKRLHPFRPSKNKNKMTTNK